MISIAQHLSQMKPGPWSVPQTAVLLAFYSSLHSIVHSQTGDCLQSLTQPASGRQDMYLVHASDNQPDEDYEQDLQDDEYFRVLESDYQDDLWSSEIPARSDDAETINREASTSRSAPDMHDQDSYHNRRWMSRPAAKESFSRHDNQVVTRN